MFPNYKDWTVLLILNMLAWSCTLATAQSPEDYAKLAIAEQVAKEAINNYTPKKKRVNYAPMDNTPSTVSPSTSHNSSSRINCESQVSQKVNCASTQQAQAVNYVPMANCNTAKSVPLNCSSQVQANCAQGATYTLPLQGAACGATQRVGFFRRLAAPQLRLRPRLFLWGQR